MDTRLKKRREEHIRNLKKLRDTFFERETYESYSEIIQAITAGAFALARINKEDFPEEEDE